MVKDSSAAHSRSGDSRVSKSKGRRQALEEELSIVRQELDFLQQGSALKERKLTKEIKELRELNHQLNGENDELAHDVQDLLRDNEEMYHELVASASHLKNLAKLNQEMETERDQLAEAFLELQGQQGNGIGGGQTTLQPIHGIEEAEVERRIEMAVRKAEAKLQAENSNLQEEQKVLKKSRDDMARQIERLKMLLELQKDSDEEEINHERNAKHRGSTGTAGRERTALHYQEHNHSSSGRNKSKNEKRSSRERGGAIEVSNNNEAAEEAAMSASASGLFSSYSSNHSSFRQQSDPSPHVASSVRADAHQNRKPTNPLVSAHKQSLRDKAKKSSNSNQKSGRNILNSFPSPFGDWGGGSTSHDVNNNNAHVSRREKSNKATYPPSDRRSGSGAKKNSRHLSSRQQQGFADDDHVATLEDPSKYPSLNGLGVQNDKKERRRS
jgi:hypothetical protein